MGLSSGTRAVAVVARARERRGKTWCRSIDCQLVGDALVPRPADARMGVRRPAVHQYAQVLEKYQGAGGARVPVAESAQHKTERAVSALHCTNEAGRFVPGGKRAVAVKRNQRARACGASKRRPMAALAVTAGGAPRGSCRAVPRRASTWARRGPRQPTHQCRDATTSRFLPAITSLAVKSRIRSIRIRLGRCNG